MFKYTIKRAGMAVLTLWVIITITFILMHSIPGDPFDRDQKKIPETIMKNLEAKYGLDKPLIEQYFIYFRNLLRGDMGISIKFENRSVNSMIATGLPISATIGIISCLLGAGTGILFGIIAGVNRGKIFDYIVIIIAILGVSIPEFVFAGLFQYIFGVKIPILPVAGWDGLIYAVLPVIALATGNVAYIARMMRTSMLDVLSQDYIKLAKSKGLSKAEVIAGHTVRNAISPVVTTAGALFAGSIVGSFVIESIFNIPGMGKHLVDAVQGSDYTVILGLTSFYAAILIVMMFVVDLLYVLIDPRVRLT